jgi:hypothetical protein
LPPLGATADSRLAPSALNGGLPRETTGGRARYAVRGDGGRRVFDGSSWQTMKIGHYRGPRPMAAETHGFRRSPRACTASLPPALPGERTPPVQRDLLRFRDEGPRTTLVHRASTSLTRSRHRMAALSGRRSPEVRPAARSMHGLHTSRHESEGAQIRAKSSRQALPPNPASPPGIVTASHLRLS